MHPLANLDPQFTVFGAFLLVGGPIGLCVSARTLYLAVRRFVSLSVPATVAVVAFLMALVASALWLGLGLDQAALAALIVGAAECTIMGTPLAKYHFLTQLDPAVAERVADGPRSWRH